MKNGISRPKEQEIYLKASLIREPGDLAAFLDVSCGDDQQLRTRIRKLLAVKPRPELFEPDPLIHEVMERLQAHGDGRPGSSRDLEKAENHSTDSDAWIFEWAPPGSLLKKSVVKRCHPRPIHLGADGTWTLQDGHG